MTTCNICYENIDKHSRKEVSCPFCEFSCCLLCFKRYLLELPQDPCCMSCRRELSLDFVSDVTPKSFHNNQYRKHRTSIVLSREKSLLPVSQEVVERMKEEDAERKVFFDQIAEREEEMSYLRFRLGELGSEIRNLTNKANQVGQSEEGKEKKERKKFIRGCPQEECRGFLSSSWKCGTCATYVCSDCHAVKESRDDNTHVCNEDDKATAIMLAKETKPCPQCAAPIYKIDGCSQMYCTNCFTPFCWNTGQRVTGVIHNPHYYQHLRDINNGTAPRNAGDIPVCGGMPWYEVLENVMRQRRTKFDNWQQCHRLVAHIREIEIPRYPDQMGVLDNSDLRIQYLLKKIDEPQWIKTLQMRIKKREKNHAINQILEMYVVTMTDLFNNYVSGQSNDLAKEANNLRNYVNRQFQLVKIQFTNVVPLITGDWLFTTT